MMDHMSSPRLALALSVLAIVGCRRPPDAYERYLVRRVQVIRQNLVNADTIADASFRNVPYRRRVIEWDATAGRAVESEDTSPFPRLYDPGHPLADRNGLVLWTNVDWTWEQYLLVEAKRDLRAARQRSLTGGFLPAFVAHP